eukprot:m.3950 g.3950  ORF g.3950 m.3950 type:complete len:60 (+) comp2915_c0_seq1:70-249(+)
MTLSDVLLFDGDHECDLCCNYRRCNDDECDVMIRGGVMMMNVIVIVMHVMGKTMTLMLM